MSFPDIDWNKKKTKKTATKYAKIVSAISHDMCKMDQTRLK